MTKTKTSFLTILLALTLFGCANHEKDSKFDGMSAHEIYKEGVRLSRKKHYHDAVEYFEALEARYPFGDYAEKAKLAEIYGYFMKEDYPSALASAERFIKVHPRHDHVDYAYYMKGLTHYFEALGSISKYLPLERADRDVQSSKDSFTAFNELIQRYPYSRYVPDAKRRLVYLRNAIAANELDAARFNIARGAYVAAANRAKNIIVHFDQSPSVEEALYIQVVAYRNLELHELAQDSQHVLALNFPHSPFLKSLS